MSIDPYIFGKSVACVILAAELEKTPKSIRRKVITHINEFNEGLNLLSNIRSKTTKARMARLWANDFLNHRLDKISEYNDVLDDFMKNVISYRYRLWLESTNLLNKKQLINRRVKNARESVKAEEWVKKNTP